MGSRGNRLAALLLDRMTTQFGIREVENQPALTNVRTGQPELVSQKRSECLRLGAVKHRVDTCDHRPSLPCVAARVGPIVSRTV